MINDHGGRWQREQHDDENIPSSQEEASRGLSYRHSIANLLSRRDGIQLSDSGSSWRRGALFDILVILAIRSMLVRPRRAGGSPTCYRQFCELAFSHYTGLQFTI